MPHATNSISNSKGVSGILSIFSSCFDILKKARPLSPSPHVVTSVITPKPGPSLASTALLAGGVFAGLVIISLIVARVIAYFSHKPTPPVALTKKDIKVVTPSPNVPTNDLATTTTPDSKQPAPAVLVPPPSAQTNGPTPTPDSKPSAPAILVPPPSAQTNGPTPTPDSKPSAPAVLVPPPSAQTNGPAPIPSPDSKPSAPPVVVSKEIELLPPPVNLQDPDLVILSSPKQPVLLNILAPTVQQPSAASQTSPSPQPEKNRPHDQGHRNSKRDEPPTSSSASSSKNSHGTSPLAASPSTKTNGNNGFYTETPPLPTQPLSTINKAFTAFNNAVTTGTNAAATVFSTVATTTAAIGSNFVVVATCYTSNKRHFSKWTKYRLIQEQLREWVHYRNVQPYPIAKDDPEIVKEIATAWNNLLKVLLNPTAPPAYTTADEQYQVTVECLREIYQKLVAADVTVQEKFKWRLLVISELCYIRFAAIELFPYLRALVELASGKLLPTQLTLVNFLQELQNRITVLNKPKTEHGMNGIAREVKKAQGTMKINFDPLLEFIPYKDGEISINGRKITLLWHGTPVSQHDPKGLLLDLVSGVLSYFPYGNKIMPKSKSDSSPPVINADYIAFIEQAAITEKNILHVVLENGEKQCIGDESGRVRARLRLGIRHPNFFVMALRLDGEFFERHDLPATVESVQSLKKRLNEQLLMPLVQAEALSTSTANNLTDSKLYNIQMEDQLAANGFCIPQKLRDVSKLPEHMEQLLNEVHGIYFSGIENIESLEQHQAFLILSYVHIMLFIIIKCDIGILEALCKDDKDRGNVIKTIFKLHFLYLTGKIDHDTLMSVFVHTLARPFIVHKNAIIKSRFVLLEHTIPVIEAAHKKNAAPKTFLFPNGVKNASYTVAQPEGQTIYPTNAASKTLEEYLAFVEYHKPAPTACNISIEELSRFGYQCGVRQNELIQKTISEGARFMNIVSGNTPLKAPNGQHENGYYQKYAHEMLLAHLGLACNFSLEETWKISCLFQPALGQVLKEPLSKIYGNPLLGISIALDEKSLNTDGYGITATYQNDTPDITFAGIYNISNSKAVIARIKVTMTMADARTGQAQFTCVKI